MCTTFTALSTNPVSEHLKHVSQFSFTLSVVMLLLVLCFYFIIITIIVIVVVVVVVIIIIIVIIIILSSSSSLAALFANKDYYNYPIYIHSYHFNIFKHSGVKWLHFKVFKAILVYIV